MQASREKIKAAVVGASGYTGVELVRLVSGHPRLELTVVTSEKSAGSPVAALFPNLASIVPLSFEALEPEAVAARADVILFALPHTKSLLPVAACLTAGKKVVDLSADYRLKDPAVYEAWYQTAHPKKELLAEAVYGLPELHRSEIRRARLVASPGCYPTAAILQLAPLVANGLIQPDSIVIDAKSGISGAGRSPALPYHFPEAHDSLEPYKIGQHRHIPEIEQELLAILTSRDRGGDGRGEGAPSLRVVFTPHLVPINRGILSTAYGRLTRAIRLAELRSLYQDFFKGERFVRVCGDSMPNPRYVRGSNFCDIGIFIDNRAGWVVTVAALDNLVKGAAGQAIQALNLMMGWPEDLGLTAPGIFP